jgi:cytochrome c oxidase subunit II
MTGAMTMANLILAAAAPPGRDRGFWMPDQASGFAARIDDIFMFITWLSVFFFILIVGLMVLFMFKYRRPAADHSPNVNAATHHTPLELTWTIIPLVLVIFIFYIGMMGYLELRQAPADAYRINVEARKWSWQFTHPNGAIEGQTLTVPKGRPVQLVMTSTDVLHSLFIPAFRVKQDVVPGRYSTLWFEATRTGQFDLFCTEYCGTGHSTMGAVVRVYEEDEFRRVIQEMADWIRDIPVERLHQAGPRVFRQYGCIQCHSLDGRIGIGPSLLQTHELFKAGENRRMDDGTTVLVDENYLRTAITNPRRYTVEGFRNQMPVMQFQDREITALIEFIHRLDEFELDDQGLPIGEY